MACYAALASVLELLDDIIHQALYLDFLLGRGQILESLHGKFSFLLKSLDDYASGGDEAADRVERRIRDAAYKVQDIIEFHITKQQLHSEFREDLKTVEPEVDSIVEEVKLVMERREESSNITKASVYIGASKRRKPTGGDRVVGLEWDLLTIKDRLFQRRSDLEVIPIVGTGGIGKTTLARIAFEDASVTRHFDCRIWITVPRDYNMNKVLQSILKSLSGGEKEALGDCEGKEGKLKGHESQKKWATGKETLQEGRKKKELEIEYQIRKYLQLREYLVVIDDVWNTQVWDDMQHIFLGGDFCGGILLTTRSFHVAVVAGSSDSLHEIQLLDPSESWHLLKERIFAHEHCSQDLEDIGMLIARKCRGLPLAIVVIAGILSEERTPQFWEKIASNICLIPEKEDLVDNSIVEKVNAIKESLKHEDLERDYAAADTYTSKQSPTSKHTMEGFLYYHKTVKQRLLGYRSQLLIIPVVGVGGIGKTVLAQNIIEDALIMQHFDICAWVTVSQDYDVITVLQNLIKSMDIVVDTLLGEEVLLLELIYKHLNGRRYLIVIDDVWSKQIWDDLKYIFPNDNNGSRVLLTTRFMNVAKHVTTGNYFLKMQHLNLEASWNMLRKKVFGQEHCPLELEGVGKSIASKCGGLPLTIVTIARLISNIQTLEYWDTVARNLASILSRDDEHLSGILSLIYNRLPGQLKACFLYMASFPKDYEINISKLTKLWVAEGFMKLEQVAEECLENLVKKNLVHVTKKRANGQFKNCTMHDLVRDFSRQRGLYECFFHDKNRVGHFYPNESDKARRIILDSFASFNPWVYDDGKYVRSFCWFSKMAFRDVYSLDWGSEMNFSNIHSLEWDSLKLLKIMDIADIETHVAPFAVSRMFLVKYLALQLGGKNKKQLPQSIFTFQNLQTLIIYAPYCESISLPSEIWKRPRLRHLIIERMILPPSPVPGDVPLQVLKYLQTLETVEDFIFTNEATLMIRNIKRLKLICRSSAKDNDIWKFYCLNNLVHLCRLEELKIAFAVHRSWDVSYLHSSGFSFPVSLTKLSLEGCRLPWEKLAVVGSLPNLKVLRLRKDAFVGETWKPLDGEFCMLKFLLMDSLNLKYWIAVYLRFPNLECLKINKCSGLEEIPPDFGNIPTLKLISVHGSKRAGESAKKILEKQESLGSNHGLQVLVSCW